MNKPGATVRNVPETTRGRGYWQSLQALARSLGLEDTIRPQFPAGGDKAPAVMPRRNFLTLMGAALALAGLSGCRRPLEKIVPYVNKPEQIVPGVPEYYATSLAIGAEVHHLLVESHEGRPTYISGNNLRVSTGGAAHPWAVAALLGLYDPDRSRRVLKNGQPAGMEAFISAWGELFTAFRANGGEGLAVLAAAFASPSLARLAGQFRATFPKARWVIYEPVSDENILRGVAAAVGQPLAPVYDFEKADVVLALDADFLGTESRAYAHALAFANRRRVASERDTMNRLYLVESTLSQTSTMADHRLTLQSRQAGAFLGALALELQSRGLHLSLDQSLAACGNHAFDKRWLRVVAEDLLSNRGRCLVLAGRRQPPQVHALTVALNEVLGNTGATVVYKSRPHTTVSDHAALARLARSMNAGAVNTLVMLGGNPVYNAPADLGFAAALSKVGHTIHLSGHVDETSRAATWRLPRRHFLESWGDVSSLEGALGVTQPLIAPLYGEGLSPLELLALLAGGEQHSGYDVVRATWQALLKDGNFERRWRKVLHDGLLEVGLAAENVRVSQDRVGRYLQAHPLAVAPASRDNLEIVFTSSPAVYDGRFANNGWLQEWPDPVTKITWDNAAVISLATARSLGVRNQELVRLRCQGRTLTIPVWIMPGQADNSITVALGYGRMAAGRVGSGVGFNAYALRTSAAPDMDIGVRLMPTGATYALACVQDHHGLDEESLAAKGIQDRLGAIVPTATLEEYRRQPHFAEEAVEHPPLESMWRDHKYEEGYQWGMSIDLNACTGCGACTIACQSENNIPIVGKEQVLNGREMHWMRVDRYFSGDIANPVVSTQPVNCVQCEMAPCESVCPVTATSHDEEGLNTMTYNRCVGTRYCANNCPYKVRRFNFFNYTKDLPESVRNAQNPDVTVRFRGVMEKCTYCVQRIVRGKLDAKAAGRELRDQEVRTACQESCPTDAIVFGNINDPDSQVSRRKAQDRDYALLGELNLRPRGTYLAKLRNPNPELEGRV